MLRGKEEAKARFIVFQNVDDIDVTSSLSIRSSASRERVALWFSMLVGGCGCVFVWFQGLWPNPCFFLRSQLTTVTMATEVEQLYLQLELINIEE